MQLAARRVAWENTQLRDMLAGKGISTEEIERFLRGREGIAARIPSGDVAVGGLPGSTAAQGCEGRPSDALPAATPTDHGFPEPWGPEIGTGNQETTNVAEDQIVARTPASKPKKRVPGRNSRARGLMRGESVQASSSTSDKPFALNAEQGGTLLPTFSDCFSPASPASASFTGDDSMLEMSCQMAAEIISGMRDNEDHEQTRSQLGCVGHEHCNVKNVTVLQLMAMD
jgi:hypothetical protein